MVRLRERGEDGYNPGRKKHGCRLLHPPRGERFPEYRRPPLRRGAGRQGEGPFLCAREDQTEHRGVVRRGRLPERDRTRIRRSRASGYAPLRLRLCREERGRVRPRLHGARGGRLRPEDLRERAGLSRHERHPQVRLRAAETGLVAQDGQRGGDRLFRPHRTDRRLGPGEHEDLRQERGSDWILSGEKRWIGLATIADVAVVWARTDEEGNPVRGFLVPTDTEGFTATDITPKLSVRASIQCDIRLEDVRLPESAMLPGARGLGGPFACLNEARYGIIWGAMGAARDCYEAALAYAKDREQF